MNRDDVLADPTAATGDDLDTVHGELATRIGELRPRIEDRTITDAELRELTGLRDQYLAVNTERQGRSERRDAGLAEAGDFLAQIDTADQATEQTDTVVDETPASGDPEQEAPSDAPTEQAAPEPVAASANGRRPVQPPAPGQIARNTTPAQAPRQTQASIAITAAADLGFVSAGSNLQFDQIGEAMASRMQALRTVNSLGGNGELVPVARMVASGVPENRKLRRGAHAGTNTARLDATVSPTAIVAAGGLCAPLEIDYSYQTIGVTGRPIRDALPTFQADRGGIQFRPDISPTTNTASDGPRAATGRWTNANDEAANAPGATTPRKGVWVVDCPDTQTAEVEAITLQLEFQNVSSRFDPETVQANQASALIWHDRFAENNLLAKLQAGSKVLTSAQVLGATRDLLVTLDRIQAYYRSVHRLGGQVTLRAIMPFWVRHLIRADIARAMSLDPMQALAITDAQIDSLLSTRGLNAVWHLDGADANITDLDAGAGTIPVAAQQYVLRSQYTAVPNFPAQIDMLLHTEGHFTFLDGGTLDLGIVRDSDLVDKNAYRQFSETWEGVAARGPEALRVIANVAPTGETAGTIDVTASQ